MGSDGLSPWDLRGGRGGGEVNTPRTPWTPTNGLGDPQHTLCLSLSLSVAVTHADETFFNTQSTVLTSPWVGGGPPEGRTGIDFGWGRRSAVLW